MREIVNEELLKKIDNRFMLSLVAAKRARQLKDGAVPLVERSDNDTDLMIALCEITEEKIWAEIVEPNEGLDNDTVQLVESIKKNKK
jgi:DNA-directed RNA polymerase subunit omega